MKSIMLASTTAAAAVALLLVPGTIAAPSETTRTISQAAALLKRDPSGQGFTHVGSDNVLRTFDSALNVIDSAPLLITRADHVTNVFQDPEEPGAGDAAAVAEARAARARSLELLAKAGTSAVVSKRKAEVLGGDGMQGGVGKRQTACVSEFCPSDEYCKGLSIYGYDCVSCLIVSNGVGNCQSF